MPDVSGRDCQVCHQPNMACIAEAVEKRYYDLEFKRVALRLTVNVYHCVVCDHVEEEMVDSEDA